MSITARQENVTWKVVASGMGGLIIFLSTMFITRQEATLQTLAALAQDNKLQIVALIQAMEALRATDSRYEGTLQKFDNAIEQLREQVRTK